jgi:hypothetical protein
MSTLAVVEVILRETQVPMSVRQIVEYAGSRLPTKSRTPDTVVARDLSMDIKRKGEASLFIRTSPGRYTLRELHARMPESHEQSQELSGARSPEPVPERVIETPAQPSLEAAQTTATPATMTSSTPSAMDAPPTSVLASAMKAERAAALPAKKLPAADEQTGTLR